MDLSAELNINYIWRQKGEGVSTKQTLLLDQNDTGDLILGAFR